jgi:hypothetical protein
MLACMSASSISSCPAGEMEGWRASEISCWQDVKQSHLLDVMLLLAGWQARRQAIHPPVLSSVWHDGFHACKPT